MTTKEALSKQNKELSKIQMSVVYVTERTGDFESISKILTDKSDNQILIDWREDGEPCDYQEGAFEYDGGAIIAWVSDRKPCTKAEAKILNRFL